MDRRFGFVGDEEDRAAALRIDDICRSAEKWRRPCFSHFLTEREQSAAFELLKGSFDELHYFYGGWPGAERRVFCALPENFPESKLADVYPFKAVTMLFPKGYSVTHRDILGSLMSLKIKREAVGDILVGDCFAVVFLLDAAAVLTVNELVKIGGVGVKCSIGQPDELPPLHRAERREGVVSSMRADAVISLLAGASRSESVSLISRGLVSRNARELLSPSAKIGELDKLSIRGYGKFQIESVGGLTKKGRLRIIYNKFV